MDDGSVDAFMQATGCESIEEAVNYLDFGGGDLEQAAGLYFASQDVRRQAASAPAFPAEVRAPIAPRRETLAESMLMQHSRQQSYTPERYRGLGRRPYGDHQFESSEGDDGDSQEGDQLDLLFAPPTDIMYEGPFEAAKKKAKRDKRWMMITIHDSREFECQAMNRDLWKDAGIIEVIVGVKEMIKEQFIFVQYGTNSRDGREHQQYYPSITHPYIAIIDPLTGERVKFWSHSITPDLFLMEISEFLSAKTVTPKKDGNKKGKKDVGMLTEEEQLEIAINASMGSKAANVIVIEDSDSEILIDPLEIYNSIQPSTSLEADGAFLTRIQFRFPDGQKVVRKFRTTDTIAHAPFDLYNVRERLLKKYSETLEEAKVLGCSLTLDYL